MSFNKNPPWARNSNSNQPMGGIYAYQGLGMQQQQNMPLMQGTNQLFNVQYPVGSGAPRSLNTMAFASQNSPSMQPQSQTGQSKFNPNQRGFSGTGVVTKIQNDFGFIDEEIFFHKNVCVKGNFPQKGERVLVEATYNANMTTKWNATRVQILPSGGGAGSGVPNRTSNIPSLLGNNTGKGYNAVPPPDRESRFDDIRSRDPRKRELSPVRRSPERSRDRDIRRDTISQESDRKRRREDREKDRDRRHSPDRRERRPVLPERRRKPAARYMVSIPKISLAMAMADVLELKRRYTNLYVPSDFFNTQIRWIDAFPPNAPYSIQKPCAFHVMAKDVESPFENDAVLDPVDADYLFSAKVMLMSTPPIAELYQKCFANAEDKEEDRDRDFVHPARLINFLVGTRGKNESMAIGGPWSPSLDGENPKSNPSVLIKTAIRSCKALTGIDLSDCTRWYRFVELYYRRSESHKGRLTPARIETVVIFLPDIRTCQPTRVEWDKITSMYKNKLDSVIKNCNQNQKLDENNGGSAVAAAVPVATANSTSSTTKNADKDGAVVAEPTVAAVAVAVAAAAGGAEVGATDSAMETDGAKVETKLKDSDEGQLNDGAAGNEKDDEGGEVVRGDPTHFSALDPKTMKVTELRAELEARGLSAKGLKAQLLARLVKVLKTEETEETEKKQPAAENGETKEVVAKTDEPNAEEKTAVVVAEDVEESVDFDISEVTVIDEYSESKPEEKAPKQEEVRKLDERERAALEKKYSLPTAPHIVVHPNRTAKSGKFDCTVMSLSLLLDYRPEDTKEHSFEVSLFAELFNEMLMRDFGFNIYKSLSLLPDKVKEEKKDDDKKKDEKKPKTEDGKEKDAKDESKSEEKPKATETKESEPAVEMGDEKKSEKDKEEKKKTEEKDSADDESRSGSERKKRETKDSKEKETKERQKMVTVDPELLLSFVYFDQSQCGYIFEKDIEDLFYTLGLSLSRAQIRKLAAKAMTRDALHYRKLTDKPKDDETAAVVVPTPPGDEDNTLLELAKGNNVFLPNTAAIERSLGATSVPPAKRAKLESNDTDNDAVVNSKNGMVMFNGALLDLKKLLSQMQRSDRDRDDTEQILVDLRKQNAELSSANSKNSVKIKDLQADVKSLSRKLGDTEQSLNTANRKSSEYFSVLASIHDRVSPMFKEKVDKTSRDKERERDRIESPKVRSDTKDKDKDTKDKGKDVKDVKEKVKEKVEKNDAAPVVEVKVEAKKETEMEVETGKEAEEK